MSGHILATFDPILQASTDVNDSVGKVDTTLDDLRSYLAPIMESWQGDAQLTYHELQNRWNEAAGGLRDVLQQISRHLGTTYEQYRSVEGAATRTWLA